MKIKIAHVPISLLAILLVVGLVAPWGARTAYANAYTTTDICTTLGVSVSTTFNATAPGSVTTGQAFTVSGINSTPSNSYGTTVTSSTLSLSATGATPATYSKPDTSTNPSPTTGATTYTSYYPNWAMTTTGAAGSKIVIKLVQATATVTGVGTVTCPLTATLATITITAPASSGGGSSGGTGSSSSAGGSTSSSTPSNAATATPSTTTTGATSAATPQAATTTPQTAEAALAQAVTMNILVVDSQKHPIKDATVTLDGQLTVKTSTNGIASFTGIRKGEHTASVVVGKQKISKQVQAGTGNVLGATVVVPSKPNILLYVFIGLGVLLLLGIIGFVLKLRSSNKSQQIFMPPSDSMTAVQIPVQPTMAPQVQPILIHPTAVAPPETPPTSTLPQQ